MTVKIDEDNLKAGLLSLVVALVEIIEEVLEREALRRMESDRLGDAEVEKLGRGLMELNEALNHIKAENGIESAVKSLRTDLDRLVEDTVDGLVNAEKQREETKVSWHD